MVKNDFVVVGRDEFLGRLKRRKLEGEEIHHNCSGICEPPIDMYFVGGFEMENVVAKIVRDWMGPNGEIDNGCPGRFWRYLLVAE